MCEGRRAGGRVTTQKGAYGGQERGKETRRQIEKVTLGKGVCVWRLGRCAKDWCVCVCVFVRKLATTRAGPNS